MSIPLASKRTKISWGFGFALWALLLSATSVAAGEPEYERKPVSHWLSILRNPSAGSTNREAIGAAFRQANAAVLSIGPAALPYLAEDLDDRESVFVQGYRKLRQQLPSSVAQRLPDPQRKRRLMIVNQYFSEITRRAGTNAIPVLIQLASSHVAKIRQTAVWSLQLVAGLNRYHVIPVFTKGALDTDNDVRRESLKALCRIEP